MSSNMKEEENKNKRKEKEEKRRKNSRLSALKPEHGPRGLWRKSLKLGALSLSWLGATGLVLAIWVDG